MFTSPLYRPEIMPLCLFEPYASLNWSNSGLLNSFHPFQRFWIINVFCTVFRVILHRSRFLVESLLILKNLVKSSRLLISNSVWVFLGSVCAGTNFKTFIKLEVCRFYTSPSHVCFYFSTVFCWRRQLLNFSRTWFTFSPVCCKVPPQPLPSCFLFLPEMFRFVLSSCVTTCHRVSAASLSGAQPQRWSRPSFLEPLTSITSCNRTGSSVAHCQEDSSVGHCGTLWDTVRHCGTSRLKVERQEIKGFVLKAAVTEDCHLLRRGLLV